MKVPRIGAPPAKAAKAIPPILRILPIIALLATAPFAKAGHVQLADGTRHVGTVSVDNGLLVRGATSVKIAFSSVSIARFTDEPAQDRYVPGLVLTNGARLAGHFSPVLEDPVRVGPHGIRVPAADVAWAVYEPFGPEIVGEIPAGKTGALLPGGDFFEGAPKGGNPATAKVLNPIFGPRTFSRTAQEIHALILREPRPQPAVFEVVTRDGSRYLALDVIARDTTGVALRHPHYEGLKIEAADLVEIRAAPSRMLAFDSQKPRTVTGEFALRNTDGSPLRIQQEVVRGLRLGGGASATWQMGIGGGVFSARVGAAAGSGLVFVVEADGRELLRSRALAANDPAQILRCAVPAAAGLTLRVEGTGDAVWADPVLLRR